MLLSVAQNAGSHDSTCKAKPLTTCENC